MDTKHCEDENMFCFIDCYSYQIEAQSNEKHVVNPRSLSTLSIEVSRVLSNFQGFKPLLIIDSLSTLIQNSEIRTTSEFLRMLFAKIRNHGSSSFVKLNSRAFHPAIIAAIQDLFDGIIETEDREDANGLNHFIRIKKMRGIKHSTSKIQYDIHPQRGLTRKLAS